MDEIIFLYQSWCPWSQRALPQWNEFEEFVNDNNIIQAFKIEGYTYQNIIVDGSPTVVMKINDSQLHYYEIGRNITKDELLDFVTNQIILTKSPLHT
jgi:thiol-disulfide isomerase/thioredoxin